MSGSVRGFLEDTSILRYVSDRNLVRMLSNLVSISQVTIAFATFRGFPWRRVPGKLHSLQKVLTIIHGALHGQGTYFLNWWGDSSGLPLYMRTIFTQSISSREVAEFAPLPLQATLVLSQWVESSDIKSQATSWNAKFTIQKISYLTNVSAFFSEFLGTAILVFIVFTVTDPGNAIPPSLAPVILFVVLLGIALCLGMQTGLNIYNIHGLCAWLCLGFAVNPARDLGPRLLTSMVGYGGAVYSFRKYVSITLILSRFRTDQDSLNQFSQYWLWGGVLASILGGLTGAFFHEILFTNDITKTVGKRSVHLCCSKMLLLVFN